MKKFYYSLGLMSGTSGDGVDASIIQSDGDSEYKAVFDKYFKYPHDIYIKIHNLKKNLCNSKDLKNLSEEIENLEKIITLFHVHAVNEIIKEFKININFIGFHGQTVFHNEKEKISIQLGDGKILSQLTKKTVVYNFRTNDLKNGGRGAPLTPIFHNLMIKYCKIKLPVTFLNLGGVANITNFESNKDSNTLYALDIGPGNCLIDEWIRRNSKKLYDNDGLIAKSGKINKIILGEGLSKYYKNKIKEDKLSYDVNDFDTSFANGLSLENGAATITEYTSKILADYLFDKHKVIVSGGGRKNKFLIESIKKKINCSLILIDHFNIDGDFIESQAFAYLAIRSYLGLPISFPETTGVKKPCVGGVVIKN